MTWQVLTRAFAGNPLAITNGATTLTIPSCVTFPHRGELLEGRIDRIVLMLDGYSVHVRTERGTFCLEPGELTAVATVPVRSEPTRQEILENRRRMLLELARADLKRLHETQASYREVRAAEALEERLAQSE